MKKTILIFGIVISILMSCENGKRGANNSVSKDKEIALIESVSQSVAGMQFKEVEVKGASKVFENYKSLKIAMICDYFSGKDISADRDKIKEIKRQFDELTLEKDEFYYVQNGIRENPFTAEFENQFMRTLIFALNDEVEIDAKKLKIIYENR